MPPRFRFFVDRSHAIDNISITTLPATRLSENCERCSDSNSIESVRLPKFRQHYFANSDFKHFRIEYQLNDLKLFSQFEQNVVAIPFTKLTFDIKMHPCLSLSHSHMLFTRKSLGFKTIAIVLASRHLACALRGERFHNKI